MTKGSYSRVTDRNRRRIQEAFAELLSKYGSMRNITVSELAEHADITRGTFYNYYNNLAEVATEIEGEIENQLFSNYGDLTEISSIEEYIDDIFVFLERQEPIYSELLSSCDTHGFLAQLENEISKHVLEVMKINGVTSEQAKLELLFLVNGTMALLRKYYLQETNLTLGQMKDFLKQKLRWLFDTYKK
jgi:AcrR family transcriptional regulator